MKMDKMGGAGHKMTGAMKETSGKAKTAAAKTSGGATSKAAKGQDRAK